MEIQVNNKLNLFNEITNLNLKNNIINILYSNINFNNIKYQLINSYEHLEYIKKNNLYVMPHIMGINCLLIFIEIENKKYQCIINKKDLKFVQKNIDINKIKIYNFWINYACNELLDLYNLTIIDGKFFINNNNLYYIISDIYVLSNIKLFNKMLVDKYKMIDNIISILNKNLNNKFIIKISNLYQLNKLDDLIYNKIKNSKFKINGLIFYPEKSGKYYIYINDNDFNKLKNKENNIELYKHLNIPNIPNNISVKYQLDENLIYNFVLKKTNITDVFEIYNLINSEKIYLNINSTNKIGIAHIPDIKTSHYCNFLSNINNIFISKCIFNKKFKKWMPIINDQ
jgi:hypothetical protein